MLKCSVNVTRDFFHFETVELKRKCGICKKESVTKKVCCGQPTTQYIKKHIGSIGRDGARWGCDCEYSSFHRFSKHWQERPETRCKHVKAALKKVKELGL